MSDKLLRITIMIPEELDKLIRIRQSNLMKSQNKNYSFSQCCVDLMQRGINKK